MIYTNNRESVFAHGAVIRECFPELTDQTIKLAEEAMKGMLVLPGTGPELYFVGNPPKWTENPVNDNEYTFHLNRMHHLKTLAEAYGLTGNLTYAQKAIEELNRKSLSFTGNLLRAKIVCEILNEDDLYNLIYRELNKNSAINISNLKEGGKNLYVGKKQKAKRNKHI